MQVCTSLHTDNHASIPPVFFTGRMPFLPPNQQRQSTEGKDMHIHNKIKSVNAEKQNKSTHYNTVLLKKLNLYALARADAFSDRLSVDFTV